MMQVGNVTLLAGGLKEGMTELLHEWTVPVDTICVVLDGAMENAASDGQFSFVPSTAKAMQIVAAQVAEALKPGTPAGPTTFVIATASKGTTPVQSIVVTVEEGEESAAPVAGLIDLAAGARVYVYLTAAGGHGNPKL